MISISGYIKRIFQGNLVHLVKPQNDSLSKIHLEISYNFDEFCLILFNFNCDSLASGWSFMFFYYIDNNSSHVNKVFDIKTMSKSLRGTVFINSEKVLRIVGLESKYLKQNSFTCFLHILNPDGCSLSLEEYIIENEEANRKNSEIINTIYFLGTSNMTVNHSDLCDQRLAITFQKFKVTEISQNCSKKCMFFFSLDQEVFCIEEKETQIKDKDTNYVTIYSSKVFCDKVFECLLELRVNYETTTQIYLYKEQYEEKEDTQKDHSLISENLPLFLGIGSALIIFCLYVISTKEIFTPKLSEQKEEQWIEDDWHSVNQEFFDD